MVETSVEFRRSFNNFFQKVLLVPVFKWLLGRMGLQGLGISKTFWEAFNTGKWATIQNVLGRLFMGMDLPGVQQMLSQLNYTDSVKSFL